MIVKQFPRSLMAALVTALTLAAAHLPVSADGVFRAFWADAFHSGFKSTSQIDSLVARAVAGKYNAIIPEVLAYHDTAGGGHGAYWNSSLVPKATDISGGIDPLAYLVQKAHAAGIEVHCWLVAYRVSTSWPPAGNSLLASHPEWLMVPSGSMGSVATVDGKYTLDPGCPAVQDHLVAIVRELAANYAIDGIHWDYIRYTSTDAGYPAVASHDKSGLRRFQRITGRTDVPAPSGDAQWDDFRRRTINELVARVRGELPLITTNPRQPLRHSAALISFGDAPSLFTSTSAYKLFQNWEHWMAQGWLDAACPMNYKREAVPSNALWYRNWINRAVVWRHDRHLFCGQANYLNTMPDSVIQMQYCLDTGANGTVNYSYAVTVDSNEDGTGETDWSWYSYIGSTLFALPAPTPSMPWRDPALATDGVLFGRVVDAITGEPIDNATVLRPGSAYTAQTDGNGYYTITGMPAAASGTVYPVYAINGAGYIASRRDVRVLPGAVSREDFAVSPLAPQPVQMSRLGEAGQFVDGTRVIASGLIVTANSQQAGANYVQQQDRSAGIRAESTDVFTPGRLVQIVGVLGTKPTGERYLRDCQRVSDLEYGGDIRSLACRPPQVTWTSGDPAAKGLGTIGLLVDTWGRVTIRSTGYFTLNDGSASGSGLKVITPVAATPPSLGAMVRVTGIAQLEAGPTGSIPVLVPRSPGDIVRP